MNEIETRPSLIVRLSDQQDQVAWADFVQIYEPLLMRMTTRFGLQDADAREVVQETLLACAKSVGRFRADDQPASFRRWLRTLARNKWIDHVAAKKRREHVSEPVNIENWIEQQEVGSEDTNRWDLNERRQIFTWASRHVAHQVQEKTWLAFYRTTVEGESVSSVAQELNMPSGMVYVARSRVMKRLRQMVQVWMETDGEAFIDGL